MVMIGDQLETDIRGAMDFGIDAALVGTGVTQAGGNDIAAYLRPTYYLQSIAPDSQIGRPAPVSLLESG